MLIAGKDILAVDVVSERIAGLDPLEVKLSRLAYERGLGELEDIRVKGDRIPPVLLRQSFFGTALRSLVPIWTSRFFNLIAHPIVKKIFGPNVRTLHSVEKDLKSSKVGSILLVGDCDQCGVCVKACKMKNISLQRGKPVIRNQDCLRCLICVEVCPKGALALSRI
jgi:ferredoxin